MGFVSYGTVISRAWYQTLCKYVDTVSRYFIYLADSIFTIDSTVVWHRASKFYIDLKNAS